jgi:CRISPR/Cas system-associated endonuclease Cas1
VGVEIARTVLREKVAGQSSVLTRIPGSEEHRALVDAYVVDVENAVTMDQLRVAEAQAALAYWGAWVETPILFARKDAEKVPEHWRTFGRRASPLTGQPRLAANPANALLSYCYSLLEASAGSPAWLSVSTPDSGSFMRTRRPGTPSR